MLSLTTEKREREERREPEKERKTERAATNHFSLRLSQGMRRSRWTEAVTAGWASADKTKQAERKRKRRRERERERESERDRDRETEAETAELRAHIPRRLRAAGWHPSPAPDSPALL